MDVIDAGGIPVDVGEIPTDYSNIPTAVSRLLCHRSRDKSTTLLHVASQFGHTAVVRLLLQHGADPSLKYDVCQLTILQYVDIELQLV